MAAAVHVTDRGEAAVHPAPGVTFPPASVTVAARSVTLTVRWLASPRAPVTRRLSLELSLADGATDTVAAPAGAAATHRTQAARSRAGARAGTRRSPGQGVLGLADVAGGIRGGDDHGERAGLAREDPADLDEPVLAEAQAQAPRAV